MSRQIENWDKPRSHGTHFTDIEQSRIRQAFKQGVMAFYLARELKCSTRVINTWYQKLASGVTISRKRKRRTVEIGTASAFESPCLVAGCADARAKGLKFCERHKFKPPPHLAKLMAGRA